MPLDPPPPSEQPTILEWIALLARPGIGIKRWLITGLFGLLILAIGIAFALSVSVSEVFVEIARRATFARSMPPAMRGILTAGVGLVLAAVSTFMLYKQLALGARYTQGNRGIIESLAHHQARSSGPKIVAIGGGTGLSTLLRGLKLHTDNISAVVTVADDGGSSGRLRDELGIAPPGDARQCLIALSESEPLMERVLSYRFSEGSDLGGHNFGNLLLAALVDIEGDFHRALESAANLLIVRGRVLPSSVSTSMRLAAKTTSGTYLAGESAVGHAGEPIDTIWVEPEDCEPNPAVLEAIADADLIVMGPGSLYTSILPSFLIAGVADAVNATNVPKVLVCNIATQAGETDGLSAADHLEIFERHSKVCVTHFLMNSEVREVEESPLPHPIDPEQIAHGSLTILVRDVGGGELTTHHDPAKLSSAVMDVLSR